MGVCWGLWVPQIEDFSSSFSGDTHRLRCELWRVVIYICDSDDGGCRVGQTVHRVALHVGGLDDQRVLMHFLKERGNDRGVKTQLYTNKTAMMLTCLRTAWLPSYLFISRLIKYKLLIQIQSHLSYLFALYRLYPTAILVHTRFSHIHPLICK